MENEYGKKKIFLQKEIRSYFQYILDSTEWDVLILITRKGYWAYKIMVECGEQKRLREKGREVYSDRYISKCLDIDQFKGKRVWIYDDTMTNGTNQFFFFSYLRKHRAKVTPHVFGLNVDYPSDSSRKLLQREYKRICRDEALDPEEERKKANNEIQAFETSLKWRMRLTSADIAKICVQEVQYFQDCMCPMVVDLPIMSCVKKSDGFKSIPSYMNEGQAEGVTMTLQQFEQLKRGNQSWEYVENYVSAEMLDINCSYFRYKDDWMLKELSGAIYDMIVKCKYTILGNYVKVVFVPFAIFQSMTFKDTAKYFFTLLRGTEYEKECLKKMRQILGDSVLLEEDTLMDTSAVFEAMKKNHNLCRSMFRGIIFYVSDIIGEKFRNYVWEVARVRLDYDWEGMKDSLDDSYIKTFEEIVEKRRYTVSYRQLMSASKVKPIDMRLPHKERKVKADLKEVERYILGRLIDKRRGEKDNIRNRIYTIETIDEELKTHFIFDNDDERRKLLIQNITALLETSRFGNEIYVDNEKEIIYRGFRYGENSDLLFLPGMEYFYAFILAFYYNVRFGENRKEDCGKRYRELYPSFMQQMEQYFRKEKYFELLIDNRTFDFLKQYFGNIPEHKLKEQITNKMYLLSNYWNPEKEKGMKGFVDKAFHLAFQWMQ